MEAPVPKGAWEAIKTQIPSAGAAPATGAGISSVNFVVGVIAGAAIITSLSVYSEFKQDDSTNSKPENTTVVKENSQVDAKTEEPSETISFKEAQAEQVSNEVLEKSITETVQVANTSELSEGESNLDRVQETADSNKPSEQVSLPAIQSMTSKESNELDTSTSIAADREKHLAETQHENNKPPSTSNNLKAEILASGMEGYAPFKTKLHNAGNAKENIWHIDGQSDKFGSIVEVEFDEPGVYTVVLSAYGEEGSLIEDEIQITVKEGSDIKLPNIFTPNGDGLNDTYKISYAKNISEFFIQIMDETGNVVYQSTDVNSEWVYDQYQGPDNRRYTVQYRAVGVDGKVHADQFPLIIVAN